MWSIVYFIRQAGLVKIGYTNNPYERFRHLRHDHGHFGIWWACLGNKATERNYHQQFANYRIYGEWFRFAGELEDFLLSKQPFNFEKWNLELSATKFRGFDKLI